MWVAKISMDMKDSFYGNYLQYNVIMSGYPFSYSCTKTSIKIYIAADLIGGDKDKKELIKNLKKDKNVLGLEESGDFFIMLLEQPVKLKSFYNPKIIYTKPAKIFPSGEGVFEFSSFDKKDLSRFIQHAEKDYGGKLISIQETKLKGLSMINHKPEITAKQKDAFYLALKEGYYEFPRKVSVEELAKKKKIPFSTFKARLRKAESKLVPYIFNYIQ